MLDLDAIKKRHLDFSGKTLFDGHVLVDLALCVEEIEQLRAAAVHEREMLVKWLRSHPPIRYGEPDPMSTLEIAVRVARGDHLTHVVKH